MPKVVMVLAIGAGSGKKAPEVRLHDQDMRPKKIRGGWKPYYYKYRIRVLSTPIMGKWRVGRVDWNLPSVSPPYCGLDGTET
jgi:hypothetical protein